MTTIKRSVRVADLLLKEAADLLARRVKDPRVSGTTLTGVHMSNDLRHAKIYFSVIGGEQAVRKAQLGLDSARNFIRREIATRMDLRYTPEIVFKHDPSLEEAAHMEELFASLKSKETPDRDE